MPRVVGAPPSHLTMGSSNAQVTVGSGGNAGRVPRVTACSRGKVYVSSRGVGVARRFREPDPRPN